MNFVLFFVFEKLCSFINQYLMFYLHPIENFPRKEKKPRPGEIFRNYVKNNSWKKISKVIWIGLPKQKTLTQRMKRKVMEKANEIVCQSSSIKDH